MSMRTGRVRHLSVVPNLSDTDEPADDSATEATRRGLVNLVLRVTVDHTRPQIWRRVRVRSDLLLSELHAVLQKALGWEDRHLHAFSVRTAGATRRFEMEETLDDEPDDEASSEERVRIDDVLTAPGSTMTYEYDFGDGWTHTIVLEQIDSDIDDLRSVCLDGARACPPEESGGPSRYAQALDIAADLSDPEHAAQLARWGAAFDPALFDADAVNTVLHSFDVGRSVLAEAVAAAPAIGKLFGRVRPTEVPSLMALLPRCELTVESSVDLPVAEIAMAKLTWFLGRIGTDGADLTGASYLKPAFVAAIREELDWGLGWVGPSNREIDHHQVTDLREAARHLGLTRTSKGRLLRTKLGAALTDDPVGMWRHAASRLPLGKETYETDAATLFLISLAASASAAHRNEMLIETVAELGWASEDSGVFDAQFAAQATVSFLDLIGAHGPRFYFRQEVSDSPSWSRRFARDALLS
ncbi:plasmid pRiA4b ORF-3 family protein [Rhodococcus sp. NPDC076796]|uniref:plasmid pRiA4b ORF-3 family protein n=1 Tax=Rhodococcus sp. NPDC076796 TaxID=3154859 RepID=UPI002ADD0BFE|nr:plasmid pRiA4b ORF-3 family protein [Rhodococcus sp. (in: high G+C Gram-positive bacteria)]